MLNKNIQGNVNEQIQRGLYKHDFFQLGFKKITELHQFKTHQLSTHDATLGETTGLRRAVPHAGRGSDATYQEMHGNKARTSGWSIHESPARMPVANVDKGLRMLETADLTLQPPSSAPPSPCCPSTRHGFRCCLGRPVPPLSLSPCDPSRDGSQRNVPCAMRLAVFNRGGGHAWPLGGCARARGRRAARTARG
jgi:hypothetical protein